MIAAGIAEYARIVNDAAVVAGGSGDAYSPWHASDAWWLNVESKGLLFTYADGDARHAIRVQPSGDKSARIELPDRVIDVQFTERDDRLVLDFEGRVLAATVVADDDDRHIFAPGTRRKLTFIDPLAHAGEDEAHGGHLTAPMSGAIVAVMVKAGDKVVRGAPLIVLEAMKMEHTIVAPADGVVASVNFGVGDRVAEGADLVDLEDA